jgi:hypothetical protein
MRKLSLRDEFSNAPQNTTGIARVQFVAVDDKSVIIISNLLMHVDDFQIGHGDFADMVKCRVKRKTIA